MGENRDVIHVADCREKLRTVPLDFPTARDFIAEHHRHHLPPQGWKFGIGAAIGDTLVGVATIGRPVARHFDDGRTLEVTRCCTDGTSNACSFLYGACWRAAKALGYTRLVTYTLSEEPGTSLHAAGWKPIHQTKGGSWSTPSRLRDDKHPTTQKTLWESR